MLSEEGFEEQEEEQISENRLRFVLVEISQLEKVLQHCPDCARLPGESMSLT
jgi:hypothetical protein